MTNLFDRAEKSGSEQEYTRSEIPLLLPTNLPNLAHFLSRGYIAPVECFGENDKYYEDFLGMAPGRLPLLKPPVPEDVIDLVQRESKNTARPVLVELDAAEFADDPVPALSGEGDRVEVPLISEAITAAAPPVVVPITQVECVHFLDADDLQQFEIRPFENTRGLPNELTSVSPDLQGESNSSVEKLQSWLSSLDESSIPAPAEFTSADKAAGAATLMAHLDSNLTEEILSLLYNRSRADGRLPPWISLSKSDLPEKSPASNVETDHLSDEITFRAVSSILRSKTPDDLVPREALEEIGRVLDESAKLSEEERTDLRKIVERIDSVLSNEAAFDGVKSDRYPALQGLMFFLIKERPGPLLQWGPADTDASMDAHLAAAAYCGLVHGHAGLPTTFRSKPLDDRLANWVSERLTAFPPSDVEPEEVEPEELEKEERPVSQTEPVPSPLQRFFSDDLESEGPTRAAAIELCKRKGWTDCVETEVFAPDRSEVESRVTSEGGNDQKLKMAWRIPGVAEFKYELDTEHFRSKIKESDIDDQLVGEIFDQYGSR